jgi:hypothetical protein
MNIPSGSQHTGPSSGRPSSSFGGKVAALLGVLISCVYLANLGGGIFLEIPDVIPGLGNLDEVFFTTVLLASLAKLGIPLVPNLGGQSQR